MEHYAGIDVSLKETSVCMVDTNGKLVGEPECLVGYFNELHLPVVRIGLEEGPLFPVAARGAGCVGTGAHLAGDPARESGTLSDDGEDGPERCAGDRAVSAYGFASATHLVILEAPVHCCIWARNDRTIQVGGRPRKGVCCE